jgi:hypothetical protein
LQCSGCIGLYQKGRGFREDWKEKENSFLLNTICKCENIKMNEVNSNA